MGVYNKRMANQRAKDQQLLPFAAKRQFVAEMDAGIKKISYVNRSQFIRDAIVEKLQREGIKIPRELAIAPERTQTFSAAVLNDASSKKVDAAVLVAAKAVSYNKGKKPKSSGV